MINDLNSEQKKALKELINTKKNIFLTGAAGTGKSHVIKLFREVIKQIKNENVPIVASTGAASLLVNGVTFNSYFGLGILAGGVDATIAKALTNRGVCERIIYTDTIIIDEISMISATTFKTANLLCQKIRQNKLPFGGIRIIAVGDFLQLGPFTEENQKVDWIFDGSCWKQSKIKKIKLAKVMRTQHKKFLDILGKVRYCKIDATVKRFLDSRIITIDPNKFEGTRIFSRNYQVDSYNLRKINEIQSPLYTSQTMYLGDDFGISRIKDTMVIADVISLKKGALVMMRINNFQDGYVNGTLGYVVGIGNDVLTIKTLSGKNISVKKHVFEFVNGNGEITAKAKNFPLTLAWAITIQKAQGASIDKALISLDRLWLHGQAYTALSRLSNPEGLHLTCWDKESFIVDKKVLKFDKAK